jgi:hypothetical protein
VWVQEAASCELLLLLVLLLLLLVLLLLLLLLLLLQSGPLTQTPWRPPPRHPTTRARTFMAATPVSRPARCLLLVCAHAASSSARL